MYFSSTFSSITVLLLAADRMYSLGIPLKYHKYSHKHALIVIFIAVLFCLVTKVFPSYAELKQFSSTIYCNGPAAPVTSIWWQYSAAFNFVFIFCGFVVYAILFAVIFQQKRSVANDLHANNESKLRIINRQWQLMNSILSLLVINIVITVPHTLFLL